MFIDESYYGMWCVRDKDTNEFEVTWHFADKKDAYDLLILLSKAK
jgi:hypothetical protein